jgi:hypothetical protein
MVYTFDSKSNAARLEGSSPSSSTVEKLKAAFAAFNFPVMESNSACALLREGLERRSYVFCLFTKAKYKRAVSRGTNYFMKT